MITPTAAAKHATVKNNVLERLAIPVCKGWTFDGLTHVLPCGLAVADGLTTLYLAKGAVDAARQAHYAHHQQRHPSHGATWTVYLNVTVRSHGRKSYAATCPSPHNPPVQATTPFNIINGLPVARFDGGDHLTEAVLSTSEGTGT